MKVTLAYIVDNKSFVFGEEWAILNKGDEVDRDGWYVCEIMKTISGSRNHYSIVRTLLYLEDKSVIDLLLEVHFLRVKDILLYKKYLSKDVLNDDRFFAWVALQDSGVLMMDVKDDGMKIFLEKVCNKIKIGMLSDLVETFNKKVSKV